MRHDAELVLAYIRHAQAHEAAGTPVHWPSLKAHLCELLGPHPFAKLKVKP